MKYQQPFKIVNICLLTGLVSLWVSNSSGQTEVTGWGYDQGATAGSASTVTDEGGGSFTATAPTGSSAIRADITPIDFSVAGESVELSGAVTFDGTQTFGNQQFRFGLFNNNSQPLGTLTSGVWSGDTASSWLGYMVEAGNGGTPNTSQVVGRSGTGSGNWDSGTGATAVGGTTSSSGSYVEPGTGIFSFNLTLTRLSSTSVGLSYNIFQTGGTGATDTYMASGSFTDTTTGSAAAFNSIDAVGFLLTGSSGGGASFSNVELISPAPEPSTFALAGVGLLGLISNRYRKKCNS
jgi:hypothetical protein